MLLKVWLQYMRKRYECVIERINLIKLTRALWFIVEWTHQLKAFCLGCLAFHPLSYISHRLPGLTSSLLFTPSKKIHKRIVMCSFIQKQKQCYGNSFTDKGYFHIFSDWSWVENNKFKVQARGLYIQWSY